MKKTILTVTSMLALAALIVGCASTSTPTPQTLALEQFAITSGTSIATAEVLQQYPQYRPDFLLAEGVLTSIATGTNAVTAAQISALLQSSGVTNSVIAPIIVNGLTLADSYAANGTNATLQQVASWISLGIAQDLGTTFKRK